MQKTSDNLNPLANAISGDVPTTVGGSSVCYIYAAGIAASGMECSSTETQRADSAKAYHYSKRLSNKTTNYGYGKLMPSLR
jgi:hypothetical protein